MTAKITIPQDEIVLSDKVLLLHMLDAANEALGFCNGQTRLSLDTNRILLLALTKEVEIICGSAAKVSQTMRDQHPEIAWHAIIDMRNHLIHGYFDIDYDRLWDTVTHALPPLMTELRNILSNDSP